MMLKDEKGHLDSGKERGLKVQFVHSSSEWSKRLALGTVLHNRLKSTLDVFPVVPCTK